MMFFLEISTFCEIPTFFVKYSLFSKTSTFSPENGSTGLTVFVTVFEDRRVDSTIQNSKITH